MRGHKRWRHETRRQLRLRRHQRAKGRGVRGLQGEAGRPQAGRKGPTVVSEFSLGHQKQRDTAGRPQRLRCPSVPTLSCAATPADAPSAEGVSHPNPSGRSAALYESFKIDVAKGIFGGSTLFPLSSPKVGERARDSAEESVLRPEGPRPPAQGAPDTLSTGTHHRGHTWQRPPRRRCPGCRLRTGDVEKRRAIPGMGAEGQGPLRQRPGSRSTAGWDAQAGRRKGLGHLRVPSRPPCPVWDELPAPPHGRGNIRVCTQTWRRNGCL